MLMRYHWGLAIGHVYAQATPAADSGSGLNQQASTGTDMQSPTDVQAPTEAPPDHRVELSGQEQQPDDVTDPNIEVRTGLPVLSSNSNNDLSTKSLKFMTCNVKIARRATT